MKFAISTAGLTALLLAATRVTGAEFPPVPTLVGSALENYPAKQRIGPFMSFLSLRTARYSRIRSLIFSRS